MAGTIESATDVLIYYGDKIDEYINYLLENFEPELKSNNLDEIYKKLNYSVDRYLPEILTLSLIAVGYAPEDILQQMTTRIYFQQFSDCYFNDLKIPDNIKIINNEAFFEAHITKLDLNNVEEIQAWAFKDCRDISQVSFNYNKDTFKFSRGAFHNCTGIEEIYILNHDMSDFFYLSKPTTDFLIDIVKLFDESNHDFNIIFKDGKSLSREQITRLSKHYLI